MAKTRRRQGTRREARGGMLDLMQYAVTGARVRLQEIAREAGELLRHFPQLRTESPSPWGVMAPATPRRRGARGQSSSTLAMDAEQPSTGRRRRRRKLSAEARAKISAAQKKRWAAQKKKDK